MKLRVGARGSDLSLAQTRWVIDRLRAAHPSLDAELIIIQTHGDRDQSAPLDTLWPPGGFVKDIERALLDGRIDLAVHSLKDIPTEPVPGLTGAAIPPRAPAHDVLITREPVDLDHLPEGFRIGTSSPRRAMQLARRAPQVRTEPIRGNLPTRLEKVARGDVDGTILAAAGLERLFKWPKGQISKGPDSAAGIQTPAEFGDLFSTPLPIPEFLPAPGQGALALQTRADDPARQTAAAIDHAPTRAAATAERAFLRASGGGCHAALGALATVEAGRLTLRGHLFRDGRLFAGQIHGPPDEADGLGARLLDELAEARP